MKNLAHPLLSFFFGARHQKPEDDSEKMPSLGKVWQGPEALQAYKCGELLSKPAGKVIRICFRHVIDDTNDGGDVDVQQHEVPAIKKARRAKKSVWFSWVDEHRALHSFKKINPTRRSTIVDSETVVDKDRIEQSYLGHAFIIVVRETDDDEEDETPLDIKSIDQATVIGGYRPSILSTDSEVDDDDYPCHVLEITEREDNRGGPSCWSFCRPTQQASCSSDFPLLLIEGKRLEPMDTTKKEYAKENICWWPVRVEKDAFGGDNKKLRETFKQDLDYCLKALPHHAYHALKEAKTHIYMNKSFLQGPKIRPSKAIGGCFHPDKEWLVKNGYNEEKAGCIEFYDTTHYQKDHDMWGRGGVLIHEFSHAYHHKCLPNGYDNEEILVCYEKAMKEGLYDMVRVHGPQGPQARAYAANNCMEYFAELSTAFLGGKNENEE